MSNKSYDTTKLSEQMGNSENGKLLAPQFCYFACRVALMKS